MVVGCSGTSRTRSNLACRIVITPARPVDVVAGQGDGLAQRMPVTASSPNRVWKVRARSPGLQRAGKPYQFIDLALGPTVGAGR